MIRSSIFYSITFIFFLAALSIFLAFLWLMGYDKQNYTKELNTRYSVVARANLYYLNNLISKEELESQTNVYKMTQITDANLTASITKESKILQEIKGDIGSSAILIYKNRNFLQIRHKDNLILLKDDDYQPYRYDIIKVIFGGVFIILLITYVFTIRKLKPLRKLKRQIKKFAQGELDDIKNTSTGSDEISQVSEAFYNAVTQIKALNSSRQLFLRNIMHELKTPITKGRITAEMINDPKYQERLIRVFEKLETLINEFASIEKLTSGVGLTNVKICRFIDILDEALDLAMVDKESVNLVLLNDIELNVDFKLFSIAVKNMIDNALKYSDDKKIKIIVSTNEIKFLNGGEKLRENLSYYLEPFTQGNSANKGFGLGLYIVENIIKAHNLNLKYEFKNSFNVFSFEKLENLALFTVQ